MATKQTSYRFVMAIKSIPSKSFIFLNEYDEKLSQEEIKKAAREYCEKTMGAKLVCKKVEKVKTQK